MKEIEFIQCEINLDEITLIIRKSEFGYIGFVKEIDGANTQAKTFIQCVMNLLEAIKIINGISNGQPL